MRRPAGVGEPPDGFNLNVGAGYVSEMYQSTVTATAPDGAVSEVEAKLSRLSAGYGGY